MYIILLIFSFSFLFSNQFNRDFLNENPIHPLPQEMTFEEYQDLNRTISTGLLLSAIPIPGSMHHYAGDYKTAKKLRIIACGGLASILLGLSASKENEWQDSPYQLYTINEGTDNEIRYEMIPTGKIGSDITYHYKQLHKTSKKGSELIGLGISILIFDYIYDYVNGIKTIKNKRDKVRFKYGKKLNFAYTPYFDTNKSMGLKIGFKL